MTAITHLNVKTALTLKTSIEYLFYLLVLMYFVGRAFEPISALIDVLFIAYLFTHGDEARRFYRNYRSLIIAFMVLNLYFLIQSFFALNVLEALKTSVGAIRFALLPFAALLVFDSLQKIKNLIFVAFAALTLVCADALYQYFNGVDIFGYEKFQQSRLTAWQKMPRVNIYMGEFFGLLLASVLLFKKQQRQIAIAVTILASIVFILAGNRSPIVAMISTVALIWVFLPHKKMLTLFLLIVTVVFSLGFLDTKLAGQQQALFNPLKSTANSGRTPIFLTAFDMIKEHPLFGVGGNNFRYEFKDYYGKNQQVKNDPLYEVFKNNTPTHVHNSLLGFLVAWGVIGVILLCYVLYEIYLHFLRNRPFAWVGAVGFFYCITPLQFAKSPCQGIWQFYTFLGLVFLVLISRYVDFLRQQDEPV